MKTETLRQFVAALLVASQLAGCADNRRANQTPISEETTQPAKATLPAAPTTTPFSSHVVPTSAQSSKEITQKLVGFLKSVNVSVPPGKKNDVSDQHDNMMRALLALEPITEAKSNNKNCHTFFTMTQKVSRAIQLESGALKVEMDPDRRFYRMARVRILAGIFAMYYGLARTGKSGGVEVFGSSSDLACKIDSPADWTARFNTARVEVVGYVNQVFGVEPIAISEYMQTLEGKKIDGLADETKKMIGMMVGMTVVSLVVWHFMLVEVGVLSTALGVGRLALMLPSTMMLGAAESLAFTYVERNWAKDETTWTGSSVGKVRQSVTQQAEWNHLMEQTDEFLKMKLASPIVYAQYLWAEHKSRLEAYRAFLHRFKPQLEELERRYGSIENAMQVLEEEGKKP